MANRDAACSCGQLRLEVAGDPIEISMCHCLACQRWTGDPFSIHARFPSDRVQVIGHFSDYVRVSDEGNQTRTFHFCPDCGGTVFFNNSDMPGLTAVPVGAFADPSFPQPTRSGYASRRHAWVALPDGIESDEAWESLRPLYEAGEYAEIADRGRELIEAHPDHALLAYNIACCESLAGRTDDAIEHLRLAIDGTEHLRSDAACDSDFDPIRDQPAFRQLIGESALANDP
jgi:hypothetical protein